MVPTNLYISLECTESHRANEEGSWCSKCLSSSKEALLQEQGWATCESGAHMNQTWGAPPSGQENQCERPWQPTVEGDWKLTVLTTFYLSWDSRCAVAWCLVQGIGGDSDRISYIVVVTGLLWSSKSRIHSVTDWTTAVYNWLVAATTFSGRQPRSFRK